ncbi:MAG: hypothetical protein E6J45_11200 [Chloroflexi bacterium]|nr:MAG: hypothetical protein E6J45_11200 [Chloroflexota bacterium]
MYADGTYAQFQSAAALLPAALQKMVYHTSGSNIASVGFVEIDLLFNLNVDPPSEATFTAAYPSAVKVGVVGQP